MKKPYTKELAGLKFGDLEVIEFSHKKGPQTFWKCRCSCGIEKAFLAYSLIREATTSCGHRKAEFLRKRAKHGKYGTKLYRVWAQMIQRCTNPNHASYKDYGGRGIAVSDAWRDFAQFELDMGSTWREGLTIDRKDNSLGYSRENCTWITRAEQLKNRRPRSEWKNGGKRPAAIMINTPNGEMRLQQAAREYGIHWATIKYRLERGWNSFDALTTPTKWSRKKTVETP